MQGQIDKPSKIHAPTVFKFSPFSLTLVQNEPGDDVTLLPYAVFVQPQQVIRLIHIGWYDFSTKVGRMKLFYIVIIFPYSTDPSYPTVIVHAFEAC